MKNYLQSGEVLTLVAPSGGVVTGVPVKIGQLLVIPITTAAVGESFAARRTGLFSDLAKVSAQAWTVGQLLYWDNTNSRFTTVSATGLVKAGVAGAIAANPSSTGTVLFDGSLSADVA
jgi:predicted RecA/RadA family phage recombinase